jgi:HNH endonuclease
MRDQTRCVITFAGEPIEVAHIYPFNGKSCGDGRPVFFLENPADVLEPGACEPMVSGRGTELEVLENLMCLAPHVHKYYERAHFTLQGE